MSIQAPKSNQLRYAMTAVLLLVLFGVFAVVASYTVDMATERFGGASWWYLIPAFLMLAAGSFFAWATIVTVRDRISLVRYRVSSSSDLSDGQQVALSGRIRVKDQPLTSPFSEQACAGYNYRVTGERRVSGGTSDNSTHRRSQLCLEGYALVPSYLDCKARRFRINAIAHADDVLRSFETGGEWGKRAFAEIKTRAETLPQTPEIDVRAEMASAHERIEPPNSVDFFVSQTAGASNTIEIYEDIMPIDREVSLLANFSASTNSLDGRRPGGMKVFPEALDRALERLNGEARQGARYTLVLLGLGLPLLSLAWWLP